MIKNIILVVLLTILSSCGSIVKTSSHSNNLITTSEQMRRHRGVASFKDSAKSHICSTLSDVSTPTMKHKDGTKYFITVGVIGYRIRARDDRNGALSDLVLSRIGKKICIDSYTGSVEGQYFYAIGASVHEREKRTGYLATE